MKRILPQLIMSVFGVLILLIIPSQINETTSNGIGSRFFPSLIGWSIIIFSLISIPASYKKYKMDKEEKESLTKPDMGNIVKIGVIFACILLWILIVPLAGFLITTTIMNFIVTTTLGNSHKAKAVLFSVILAVSLYFVFGYLLNINLPEILI